MFSGRLVVNAPGPSGRGGASIGIGSSNKEIIPHQNNKIDEAKDDVEPEYGKKDKKRAKTLAELAKEHEEL